MIARWTFATILTLLLLGAPLITHAQTVEVQAQGSVTFGWRLKPEDRQQAVQKAKMRALETYVARDSKSLSRYFASKKSGVIDQLDDFILSTTVIEENEDKKAKTYTVFIRAEVAVSNLRGYLEGESETGQASGSGVQSSISIIFLVRQQLSVQSFDDKVYKRADASASANKRETFRESSTEGESINDTNIQTSGGYDRASSAEANSAVSTTTGGSRTRKTDRIEWSVGEADTVSTAMQGVLSEAGYDLRPPAFINGLDIASIQQEFSSSPNLSSNTLQAAVRAVHGAGIPIMAVGTADVEASDTDPVTGNIRVNVRVSGQVLDLRSGLPRMLASVGPFQISGQNVDESSARADAVRISSEKAAQAIVDALNAKQVR